MNLDDRQQFFRTFWDACLDITRQKGPDYNPDAIPLMDVLATAIDANISVPQVLWAYYAKHASAIRRNFLYGEPLSSEPILGRMMDAANYLAMMAFYDTYKRQLHAAWREHWGSQLCACPGSGHPQSVTVGHQCQRCETLNWLAKQALNGAFDPISSRSIPRAQD